MGASIATELSDYSLSSWTPACLMKMPLLASLQADIVLSYSVCYDYYIILTDCVHVQ